MSLVLAKMRWICGKKTGRANGNQTAGEMKWIERDALAVGCNKACLPNREADNRSAKHERFRVRMNR